MTEAKDPETTATASASPMSGEESVRPRSQAASSLPLVEVPVEYYLFEGEHGRGGIGVVMRARDRRTDRVVALKQLQSLAPQDRHRFEREMRLTARLQHPGVVPVHETGCFPTGEPFYTMKLVHGGTLRDAIATEKSLRERLSLLPRFLAVVEAIAYAHSQGVIHRDLKPSNVVLGEYGETVVIDWGLARDLSDGTSDGPGAPTPFRSPPGDDITRHGQVVGTPAYMSPEQARAESVDERTDVYSLGAILYHLATGHPPYRGNSSKEVLSAVIQDAPPSVDVVMPDVPADLAAIVTKAMARARADRYPNAVELAKDVHAYVTGQLVSAHSYSAIGRFRKLVRRHERAFLVALLATVTLLIVVSVGGWRLREQRNEIASALRESDVARVLATTRLNDWILSEAQRTASVDSAQALVWLSRYPLDGARWEAARQLAHELVIKGLPIRVFATKEDDPDTASLSRDGRWLGVSGKHFVALLDARSGSRVWSASASSSLVSSWTLPLGPDGVILAARDGNIYAFRGSTKPEQMALGCSPASFALSDDETMAAALCSDWRIAFVDLSSKKVTFVGTHSFAARLEYHRARDSFVSIGRDSQVRFWNARSGTQTTKVDLGQGQLIGLRIASSGDLFVISIKGAVFRIDGKTLRPQQITVLAETSYFFELSAGARYLCAALASSERIVVVDLDTGRVRDLGPGRIVATHPTNQELLVGRADGSVTVFNLSTSTSRALAAHTRTVNWVSYTGGGQAISLASDGTARLWSASLLPAEYPQNGWGPLEGLQQDPNTDRLLVMSTDGRTALWDHHLGWMASSRNHQGAVVARFSPDGKHIVSVGTTDETAVVMDEALRQRFRFQLGSKLNDVRFEPNSRHAIVARVDGSVSVIDLQSGEVKTFHVSSQELFRARWSPDGSRILAGSTSGEVFELAPDGSVIRRVQVNDSVTGIAVTRADGLLVTGLDGTMSVVRASGQVDVVARCKRPIRRTQEDASGSVIVAACSDESGTAFTFPRTSQPPSETGSVMDADIAPNGKAIAYAMDSTKRLSVWWPKERQLALMITDEPPFDVELTNSERELAVISTKTAAIQLWRVDGMETIPGDDGALAAWITARASLFLLPE